MYSQCPDCLTRFRVTADVLKIAHGTVRCGRCGMAFDALARLSDAPPPANGRGGPDPALDETTRMPVGASVNTPPVDYHFSAKDVEQLFTDSRDWGRKLEESRGPVDLGNTGGSTVLVVESEPLEDITLEGEGIQIDQRGDLKEIIASLQEADLEAQRGLSEAATDEYEILPDKDIAGALLGDLEDKSLEDTDVHRTAEEIAALLDQLEREEALQAQSESAAPRQVLTADLLATIDELPAAPQPETGKAATGQSGTGQSGSGPAGAHPSDGPQPATWTKATPANAGPSAASSPAVPPTAPPATPAAAPQPAPAVAPAPASTLAAGPQPVPAAAPAAAAAPEPIPAPTPWRAGETINETAVLEQLEELAPTRRRSAGGLLALPLLLLALLAQLVHYFRHDLARDPRIGPALTAAYERLGLPLSGRWDPTAFELREWPAAQATPPSGRMALRASITNRAPFAQPYPLLRVEVLNRFGAVIGTRDFEPAQYLKDPQAAQRKLDAGASVEANLDLLTSGGEAVGHRLDLCMRESATTLRCAHGPE